MRCWGCFNFSLTTKSPFSTFLILILKSEFITYIVITHAAEISWVVMCSAGSGPNSSKAPVPLFKRVVIVLIDALREDFVFGSDGRRFMPYTRNVVERGSSHSFIAKARPPTVTMPRIKVNYTQLKSFLNLVCFCLRFLL